ncbi:uncharacterized protein LOC121985376 [Zingiber officinale]|uniref:uncharacterized protein LOC121985376 n=1 Tax=Zingiber officinale TaxID=94328 RepID=UPI001C4B3001|nr:uncharacterized protein LOC121985376 [Zingiber officinale]
MNREELRRENSVRKGKHGRLTNQDPMASDSFDGLRRRLIRRSNSQLGRDKGDGRAAVALLCAGRGAAAVTHVERRTALMSPFSTAKPRGDLGCIQRQQRILEQQLKT